MKVFGTPYKTVDNRKFNTWCRYTKRLDTYGCGCIHDCHYCYASALLDFRGKFNTSVPAIAELSEIRNKLNGLTKYDVVRIGGMTDCFQPIERELRITYQTIVLLNYLRISYLIVTKSDLVASDEYCKIYDKELAHFQISISSTGCKSLEYEKCPTTDRRIVAIEKLYRMGFDVSVRLSPFMFEWCDFDVINSINCDKILIEFLKVNHWIQKRFKIDYSEYSLHFGGHLNLQLERKIELVEKITGFKQKSVGEYVKDHYLYFRDNVNFNKNDCCNLNLKHYETINQLQLWR